MSVKMTVAPKFKHFTLVLCLSGMPLALSSCSGQQQEDTGDIITNTDDGSGDGGSASNDENESDGGDDGSGSEASGGGDDGGTAAADGGEDGAEAPATNPAGGEATAAAPPANPAGAAPAAAAPGGAPAAAAPASEQAPIAGGRVRYVKESGTNVTSQAGGGSVVRTLSQGDHPVTWEDGSAYKIGTGMYVAKEAMSDTGIPRTGAAKAH